MENSSFALWLMTLSLFLTGISSKVLVRESNGHLYLTCESSGDVTWRLGENELEWKNKTMDIGQIWDDPRGLYSCSFTDTEKHYINVYVRMCQYCIELDIGTISGFLVADIIMIVLIAVAVYCVSGSETRRPARASDRQNLIQNDSLYQHLGERQETAYSRLAPRKI
ncbi:T-cell surface glycoprotein CD3 delta chain [Discoglossus pictus]